MSEQQPIPRIEAGSTGISSDDCRALGSLRGYIAWTLATYKATRSRDREAELELLIHETDDIIERVRRDAEPRRESIGETWARLNGNTPR